MGQFVDNSFQAEIRVEKVAQPGGADYLGIGSCVNRELELRNDLTDQQMEDVGRHGIGHILGLRHTGDDDSFGGSPEAMSVCDVEVANGVSQDDAGSLTHKNGALSPETLHANASFEAGASFWGNVSTSRFDTTTSNPLDGPTSRYFRKSGSSGATVQIDNTRVRDRS